MQAEPADYMLLETLGFTFAVLVYCTSTEATDSVYSYNFCMDLAVYYSVYYDHQTVLYIHGLPFNHSCITAACLCLCELFSLDLSLDISDFQMVHIK